MQRGIFFHLFFAKRKGEAKRKVFAYGAKMMVGRMERSDILRGNESKACFRQKVKHCPTLLKEKVKKKKSVSHIGIVCRASFQPVNPTLPKEQPKL